MLLTPYWILTWTTFGGAMFMMGRIVMVSYINMILFLLVARHLTSLSGP